MIGGAPLGGSHTSGTGNSSDIVNPSDIQPRESTINDASQNITPTEIDMLEDDDDNATVTVIPTTTSTPGATNLMFRGLPVRIDEDAAAASHLEINRRTTQRRNIRGTDDNIDNRSRPNMRVDRAILFQDGIEGTPHTQAT